MNVRHIPPRPQIRRPMAALPRWLRPKLSRDQILDLALAHTVNLDTIARGEADEELLWQHVGGILVWSEVARRLAMGLPEMQAQLELADRLIARWRRTGRVAFDGPDYQLAKKGVLVMDELAAIVDQPTASAACDWSERELAKITGAST